MSFLGLDWPRSLLKATLCALTLWFALYIWHCREFSLAHDELNYIYESLRILSERRLTGYSHGPLLYEIMAVFNAVAYVLLRLAGVASDTQSFLVLMLGHQAIFLSALRFFVALAALGTIYSVYRLGCHFGGESVGALASFLCGTNLTFFTLASMGKEDIFFWLFLTIAMEKTWTASANLNKRDSIIAGLAIGACGTTKYLAFPAALLLLLPGLRKGRPGWKVGILMTASASVIFLILFPFVLTDTLTVLSSLHGLKEGSMKMGSKINLSFYLTRHWRDIVGIPFIIIAVAESAYRLRRDRGGPIVLLAVPFAMLAFMCSRPGISFAYYMFPWAIACFILAASGAMRLARIWKDKYRHGILAVFLLLTFGHNAFFLGSLKQAGSILGPDTRELGYDVMTKLAEPGSSVLINWGVAGLNALGPDLTPLAPPKGHGPFTLAREKSFRLRQGPKYRIRIVNMTDSISVEETETYDWLVIVKPDWGSLEKMWGTWISRIGYVEIPKNHVRVRKIQAFPEPRSAYYPALVPDDYEVIRNNPIGRFWENRARGMSFNIYQRQNPTLL